MPVHTTCRARNTTCSGRHHNTSKVSTGGVAAENPEPFATRRRSPATQRRAWIPGGSRRGGFAGSGAACPKAWSHCLGLRLSHSLNAAGTEALRVLRASCYCQPISPWDVSDLCLGASSETLEIRLAYVWPGPKTKKHEADEGISMFGTHSSTGAPYGANTPKRQRERERGKKEN